MPTATGVGATLEFGDGASPEVFTAIGKVATWSGPELTKEEVDDTTLDSAGGFKEFLSGLKDPGQVTFTVHRSVNDQNQEQIITDMTGSVGRNWRLTWVSLSPNWIADFSAEVFGITPSADPNAPITMDVTLRISGVVTWTP